MKLLDRNSDPDYEIYGNGRKQDRQPGRKLVPIEKLMKNRDRKIILKKLFDNQNPEFEKLIEKLNKVQTWKETFRIVEEEFNTRGINQHQYESVLFTDILFRRFYPD